MTLKGAGHSGKRKRKRIMRIKKKDDVSFFLFTKSGGQGGFFTVGIGAAHKSAFRSAAEEWSGSGTAQSPVRTHAEPP